MRIVLILLLVFLALLLPGCHSAIVEPAEFEARSVDTYQKLGDSTRTVRVRKIGAEAEKR